MVPYTRKRQPDYLVQGCHKAVSPTHKQQGMIDYQVKIKLSSVSVKTS